MFFVYNLLQEFDHDESPVTILNCINKCLREDDCEILQYSGIDQICSYQTEKYSVRKLIYDEDYAIFDRNFITNFQNKGIYCYLFLI